MKIVKKDYPFTIIIEDKTSKTTFKKYQAISLAYTEKNKNATNDDNKYKTTFINFFDERDLLKLSSVAENAYQVLKEERERERKAEKQSEEVEKTSDDFINDEVPF